MYLVLCFFTFYNFDKYILLFGPIDQFTIHEIQRYPSHVSCDKYI